MGARREFRQLFSDVHIGSRAMDAARGFLPRSPGIVPPLTGGSVLLAGHTHCGASAHLRLVAGAATL